jgi:hypothetical protein
MEFEVFSSPLPEVAARAVVQLVSSFWLEDGDCCAKEVVESRQATTIAAARRGVTMLSRKCLNS